MADNVAVTEGSGKTIATDDVGGVQYQIIKVDLGADGAASPLVRGQATMANSLPVAIASNQGALTVDASGVAVPVTDNAGSLTVDGTVTANAGTNLNTSALATHAKQDTAQTALDAIKTAVEILDNTVSGSELQVDVLTIAAGNNNIGDVDVASVPADPFGANADAASATGSISAKLRFIAATGIPITGTVAVTQSGTWDEVGINDSGNSITVDNGGTFAVQAAITAASGSIGSGAIASGAVASGAFASGSIGSGAIASGAIASGAIASGAIAAGAIAAGATSIAANEDDASADLDRGVKILVKRLATPANSSGTDGDYEQPQISIGHLWVAPPPVTKVSVNFNRPANTTAYAANDAVNDNATGGGGSSTELSWSIGRSSGIIRRVRIKKTDQTVATATIRLWLYDTAFASGAGDNEAFVHPATDSVGYVDVAVTSAGTDDAVGWNNCDIPFTGATLYGQLQTLSAFTPADSETFTIDLWYLPG